MRCYNVNAERSRSWFQTDGAWWRPCGLLLMHSAPSSWSEVGCVYTVRSRTVPDYLQVVALGSGYSCPPPTEPHRALTR